MHPSCFVSYPFRVVVVVVLFQFEFVVDWIEIIFISVIYNTWFSEQSCLWCVKVSK